MRWFKGSHRLASVAWLLAIAAATVAAGSARAADDPWGAGNTWLSVRAGYARNAATGAGNSGAGYGFGFSHMFGTVPIGRWKVFGLRPLGMLHWSILKEFAIGGYVHYDVLGRIGGASEIEIPASVELVRHFRWKTAPHPYLGAGFGPFYRKTYRTGDDHVTRKTGYYLTAGMNTPVAPMQLLGLDLRWARVGNKNDPPSPVFGSGQVEATHWSIKLNYSVAY